MILSKILKLRKNVLLENQYLIPGIFLIKIKKFNQISVNTYKNLKKIKRKRRKSSNKNKKKSKEN